MMIAGQCTPHFLFGLAEKKTGRARSKRKERFLSRSGTFVPPRCTGVFRDGAGKTSRPSAGSRRTAWSSRPFPASGSLAKISGWLTHCLCVSYRCRWPGGRREIVPPTWDQAARSEAERAEREAGQMRPCTPTRSAPSATGRQYRPRRRPKRARRQGKIGACTDTPTPVARGGPLHRSAPSAFFSSTGRGAFSFWARPKGAPAAPRAVGRGGARERAQFSPQAETELSGLCDDAMGGAPPWERPPAGADIPRAAGCRPYGSLRSDRPAR